MMNQNNPAAYDINKAYRNQKEQRASREQQAQQARTNKKGISVVKVISQIVMAVK